MVVKDNKPSHRPSRLGLSSSKEKGASHDRERGREIVSTGGTHSVERVRWTLTSARRRETVIRDADH